MTFIFAAMVVIGWILDNTILTVVGAVLGISALVTGGALMYKVSKAK